MQQNEEIVWTPEGYVALVDGLLVSIPLQRLYPPEEITNEKLWLFTHWTRWGARRTLRKRRKKLEKEDLRKTSVDILKRL